MREPLFHVIRYHPTHKRSDGRVYKDSELHTSFMPGIENVASSIANHQVKSLLNDPPEARVDIHIAALHDDSHERVYLEQEVWELVRIEKEKIIEGYTKMLNMELENL